MFLNNLRFAPINLNSDIPILFKTENNIVADYFGIGNMPDMKYIIDEFRDKNTTIDKGKLYFQGRATGGIGWNIGLLLTSTDKIKENNRFDFDNYRVYYSLNSKKGEWGQRFKFFTEVKTEIFEVQKENKNEPVMEPSK